MKTIQIVMMLVYVSLLINTTVPVLSDQAAPPLLEWATVLEFTPDPIIIKSAQHRTAIEKLGLPWKVMHKKSGITMLLVPPGKYKRGELAVIPEERIGIPDHQLAPSLPAHYVQISNPFYLGQTEVTIAQWADFSVKSGYKTAAEKPDSLGGSTITPDSTWRRDKASTWKHPSPGLGKLIPAPTQDDPVAQISPADADAFTNYYDLALPTEAEWEYAARAGTNSKYWWGNNIPITSIGEFNVVDQTAKPHFSWRYYPFDDGYITVAPTNRKTQANPWGFVDILGNLAEWMANQYTPDHYVVANTQALATPAFDMMASGEARSYRGGCWDSSPGQATVYVRGGYDRQTDVIGFRVLKAIYK